MSVGTTFQVQYVVIFRNFRHMGIMPGGYALLDNHYGVILADPPWTFITRSTNGKGRSPEQHYGCMDLLAIKQLPIAPLAKRDCALFLWVTDPHLKLGMEVMEAWDFTYKTVGHYWVKRNKNARPIAYRDEYTGLINQDDRGTPLWTDDQFFTGMGYWTRANPEQCLYGTRGNPHRLHKDVRKLIVSKRREHSRKPDETYPRIERLLPGPYLELFARTAQPGWDSWGNEVGKFVPQDVNSIDNGVKLVHNQ